MDYTLNEKYATPTRNILLGNITFQHSSLPELHRKLLIVAVNAYLLDADTFLPYEHLHPLMLTVMGKYVSGYVPKVKAYYNLIHGLADTGEKLKLKPFKVFKKRDTLVCGMKMDTKTVKKVQKGLRIEKELEKYRQMYSSLVESLIAQQQEEAKEYFDNYTPFHRKHNRRFDYPLTARRTTESFVADLQGIFGNDYDFSNVKYVNAKTMVRLTCLKHGNTFMRTPCNLLKGVGCPMCRKENGQTWADVTAGYDKRRRNDRWTTERFIQESKDTFGDDIFDYSLCKYTNSKTPVILIRKSDGKQLRVLPYEHLRQTYNYDGEQHYYEGKTDREKIHYIAHRMGVMLEHPVYVPMQHISDSSKSFRCICPVHGEFKSNLTIVNRGHCCPDCDGKGESIGERNIRRYLQSHSIPFVQEYEIKDKRFFEHFARVDFYLPERKIFIEFNGEQHYGIGNKSIAHGTKSFEQQLQRDTLLRLYAKEKDIELVEVPYIFRNNVGDFLDRYLFA